MSVINITNNNFNDEVIKSEKPVLIDFWASWCGPCKMLSPVVDKVAAEHPEIKVCKVNIDEQEALAEHFGIMSIPTLMVFKDGKPVKQSVGVIPERAILALI